MPISRGRSIEPQKNADSTLWASETQTDFRRELLIGRFMAAIVHPFTALRVLSVWWWFLILLAYAATAYLVVFGALLLLELP